MYFFLLISYFVPLEQFSGHAVAQLVETLCYKSEGRGFES
jgi:hypothetical protein